MTQIQQSSGDNTPSNSGFAKREAKLIELIQLVLNKTTLECTTTLGGGESRNRRIITTLSPNDFMRLKSAVDEFKSRPQ